MASYAVSGWPSRKIDVAGATGAAERDGRGETGQGREMRQRDRERGQRWGEARGGKGETQRSSKDTNGEMARYREAAKTPLVGQATDRAERCGKERPGVRQRRVVQRSRSKDEAKRDGRAWWEGKGREVRRRETMVGQARERVLW